MGSRREAPLWDARQLEEVGRVHLETGDRLELGGDLLEPEAGPERDVDVRGRPRLQQRGHELVGRHRFPQDERARAELAREVALDREQHERAAVGQEALVLEALGDRRRRLAGADRESDLLGVGRGRVRELGPEVGPDHVGDEGDPQRAGIVRRPVDDGALDDRPEDRDERDEDDRREDQREHEEPQDAVVAAARSTPAPAVAVAVAGRCRCRCRTRSRPFDSRVATRRRTCPDPVDGPVACRAVHPPERIVIWGSPCRRSCALGPARACRVRREVARAGGPVGSGCSCVELVLEDDRGSLAIDPGAIGVALHSRRRPAGTAPFHGTHPRFGEVARQTLVAEGYRQTQDRGDRGDPLAGHRRLRAFVAVRVERQPDDELVDGLLRGHARERRGVRRRVPARG